MFGAATGALSAVPAMKLLAAIDELCRDGAFVRTKACNEHEQHLPHRGTFQQLAGNA